MPDIHVSESREISAAAPVLYDLIADYETGHPRILPKRYFGALEVLVGGRGAGTTIRFTVRAFGGVHEHTGEITEPQPGTELKETLASGMVTTYRVVPQGPNTATVTITTAYSKAGPQGWIERMLVPPYLRRVYVAELEQLADVAAAGVAEARLLRPLETRDAVSTPT
jgi:hypothetical protein